jgi:hypothetical protein
MGKLGLSRFLDPQTEGTAGGEPLQLSRSLSDLRFERTVGQRWLLEQERPPVERKVVRQLLAGHYCRV